jgi:hypothetical protein
MRNEGGLQLPGVVGIEGPFNADDQKVFSAGASGLLGDNRLDHNRNVYAKLTSSVR